MAGGLAQPLWVLYIQDIFLKKYYIKKYVIFSLLSSTAILLSVVTYNLAWHIHLEKSMISQSLFYGGTVGVYLTYIFFKKKNLWVLYNNLQINKILLLITNYFAFQLVFQSLYFITTG